MKRFGRTILPAILIGIGTLMAVGPARAQQLTTGPSSPNQIQLQQEQQAILALPEHPASQAPPVGDFYTLQFLQNWPPLPVDALPVDALHLNFWIVGHDGSGNSIVVLDNRQVNWNAIQPATASTIQQSEWSGGATAATSATTLDTTDTNSPPAPGGGGTTNAFTPYNLVSFDTNGLWLQITNVDSNLAYASAMNATDMVYAVWCAQNLEVTVGMIQRLTFNVEHSTNTPLDVGG